MARSMLYHSLRTGAGGTKESRINTRGSKGDQELVRPMKTRAEKKRGKGKIQVGVHGTKPVWIPKKVTDGGLHRNGKNSQGKGGWSCIRIRGFLGQIPKCNINYGWEELLRCQPRNKQELRSRRTSGPERL